MKALKSNPWKKTLLSTALTALTVSSAWAQTSATSAPAASGSSSAAPAAGSSTTAAPAAPTPSLRDKLTLSYLAIYDGPSVVSPLENSMPIATDNEFAEKGGDPTDVRNQITLGYRLTPKLTLGSTLYFTVFTKGEKEVDGAKVPTGINASMNDAQLRLTAGSLYNNKGLNVGADFRYGIPNSAGSVANQKLGYFRSTQFLSYEIPNSRFSLNLTTLEIWHAFAANAPRTGYLDLYAGPSAGYQITPTLQATLLFDAPGKIIPGQGFVGGDTDLEPGLSWDITPNVNFSPYLDLKTATGVRLETTSINASLSWRLL